MEELDEVWERIQKVTDATHDLDKRLYLAESNLKRIDDLTINVVAKIDNLADRIVISLSKMIEERVKLHNVECRASNKSVQDNENGKTTFPEWVIRSLITIIMLLLGFLGKTWMGN